MRANDFGRREHLIVEFPEIVTGEEIAHEEFWQPGKSKQMQNRREESDEHLRACRAVCGHVRERWLRQYVGSKLRNDPIFRTAFELFGPTPKPLLDVGCGIGLLGFYLRAREWNQRVVGVDRDERKIKRAREIAIDGGYVELDFHSDDVRIAVPEFAGNVALFDVLHYLSRDDQRELLFRLARNVAPGGMLVIRDAPRDGRPRFWLTFVAELFAQAISWNVGTSLHFPSREELAAPFAGGEFSHQQRPLWGTTPFNNHLFIFSRHTPAAVAVAG